MKKIHVRATRAKPFRLQKDEEKKLQEESQMCLPACASRLHALVGCERPKEGKGNSRRV